MPGSFGEGVVTIKTENGLFLTAPPNPQKNSLLQLAPEILINGAPSNQQVFQFLQITGSPTLLIQNGALPNLVIDIPGGDTSKPLDLWTRVDDTASNIVNEAFSVSVLPPETKAQ